MMADNDTRNWLALPRWFYVHALPSTAGETAARPALTGQTGILNHCYCFLLTPITLGKRSSVERMVLGEEESLVLQCSFAGCSMVESLLACCTVVNDTLEPVQ